MKSFFMNMLYLGCALVVLSFLFKILHYALQRELLYGGGALVLISALGLIVIQQRRLK